MAFMPPTDSGTSQVDGTVGTAYKVVAYVKKYLKEVVYVAVNMDVVWRVAESIGDVDETFGERIASLEEHEVVTNQKLISIDADIASLWGPLGIEGVQDTITNSIYPTLNSQAGQINDLTTQVGMMGETIANEISPAIDANNQSIINLTGVVDGVGASVTALESRVGAVEGTASSNTALIDTLDVRLTSAEGDVASNITRITALEGDVTDLDTRVGDTETEITNLWGASGIQGLQDQLTNVLTPAIDANTQAISTANGRIDDVAADITQVETNVSTQGDEIDALDQRVTTLENNSGGGGSSAISGGRIFYTPSAGSSGYTAEVSGFPPGLSITNIMHFQYGIYLGEGTKIFTFEEMMALGYDLTNVIKAELIMPNGEELLVKVTGLSEPFPADLAAAGVKLACDAIWLNP